MMVVLVKSIVCCSGESPFQTKTRKIVHMQVLVREIFEMLIKDIVLSFKWTRKTAFHQHIIIFFFLRHSSIL